MEATKVSVVIDGVEFDDISNFGEDKTTKRPNTASIGKRGDEFYFTLEYPSNDTKWVKVSSSFRDAFMNEFGKDIVIDKDSDLCFNAVDILSKSLKYYTFNLPDGWDDAPKQSEM